jgi:hypothetical protein
MTLTMLHLLLSQPQNLLRTCSACVWSQWRPTHNGIEWYAHLLLNKLHYYALNKSHTSFVLSGQLFKFDGCSGGWYSAISAQPFQWNMRIHTFDGCPVDSNKFTTGVGFNFFDAEKKTTRKIEINVVINEFNVDVGCGSDSAKNCLGAGSLEMTIDGKKYIMPGEYSLDEDDKSTDRIVAFNTFHQCSRKWYDFDIAPREPETSKCAH